MWISGSPGSGKSAIASTLVSNLVKRGQLASFFFFKHDHVILSDPTVLWRTVAHDFAQFHPSLKSSILEFLKRPGFRDTTIKLHFDSLIEQVLWQNHEKLSTVPLVVVIDALDECGLDTSHTPQRRVLLESLNRWSRLPRSCKLVVTSRNERVPKSFHDSQLCTQVVLETGDSVGFETTNDIRLFFTKAFDDIRPTLGLPDSWPEKSVFERLTKNASGLFMWAKTAMAFLEEGWDNPIAKLELILHGKMGNQNENIDALYQRVLEYSFKGIDNTTLELFRVVVGAVIVSKIPLGRCYLKYCLAREDDEADRQINVILDRLSSVMETNGFLSLRHLSFAEFLCDPDRCCNPRFVIDCTDKVRHNRFQRFWYIYSEVLAAFKGDC